MRTDINDWAIEHIVERTGVEARPIPGFPGYYADALGGVWSTHGKAHNDGLPVPPFRMQEHGGAGKKCFSFFINGVPTSMSPARVTALAFHGPPPSRNAVARHLHPQYPCYPDNVAWGTPSEVAVHRIALTRLNREP